MHTCTAAQPCSCVNIGWSCFQSPIYSPPQPHPICSPAMAAGQNVISCRNCNVWPPYYRIWHHCILMLIPYLHHLLDLVRVLQ